MDHPQGEHAQERLDAQGDPVRAVVAGRLHPRESDPARVQADLPAPCVQCHAANLAVLRNGDLGCVWFAGTQEGIADSAVWLSRLPAGSDRWTAPVRLSDDPTRSEQNPILFPAPDGTLRLFYTAQPAGHQDQALVRTRVSADDGATWGPVEQVFDTPGLFVRQAPVVRADGAWLLPVFRCRVHPGETWVGDRDDSAVMLSHDAGRHWHAVEVPGSTGCVHMNIVPASGAVLLAFFRSRWADAVYRSRSEDGGTTWSEPRPTALPNNNSSIQVARLPDGRLAIAYNHASASDATGRRVSLYDDIGGGGAAGLAPAPPPPGRTAFWGAPRAPLSIALSGDDGATWGPRRDLEIGDGYCMTNNSAQRLNREYSYPSIRATPDGRLHVAYTVFRQKIRYARVDAAWVGAPGGAL